MPSEADTLYRAVLELTALDTLGADYLAGRALDPDTARAYGFRSLPSADAWSALADELRDSFLLAEIGWAGLDRLPWAGRVPALVLPYWQRGAVVGLRFRNLSPESSKDQRYWSLAGAQPPVPFNADALDKETSMLHLVEGELNAYTLGTYGLVAIGVPGAASWKDEWTTRIISAIGRTGLLVSWYDDDAAGERARTKLGERLTEARGVEWLARHARTAVLRGGDANDLHRAGTLRLALQRAGIV